MYPWPFWLKAIGNENPAYVGDPGSRRRTSASAPSCALRWTLVALSVAPPPCIGSPLESLQLAAS
eukprot:3557671-Heterocapsa_arctica.AAC.1